MIRLFLVLGILLSIGCAEAQSLLIQDDQENSINGDTIFVEMDINDLSVEVYAGLKNTGANAIDVNVTRFEENVLSNTSSYFCWGVCTGVTTSGDFPVVTPSGSVNFQSGASVPSNDAGFTLHYDPNFQLGTSLFRIKFFDITNPDDSSHVYISITSKDYVSLSEIEGDDFVIYPNPAKGVLYFSEVRAYALLNIKGELIRNGKGNKLLLTEIRPGVYFLQTKKGSTKVTIY